MNRLNTQTVNRLTDDVPVFEIKKHKSCDGSDGIAYSCELWVNGRLGAFVNNEGRGGSTWFRWVDADLERITTNYVDCLPLIPSKTETELQLWPNGRSNDLECFIAELCDKEDEEKRIRKLCRTKTVFRLKSDEEHLYTLTNPFSAAAAAHLRAKHGDNLKEIFNEQPKYASAARN